MDALESFRKRILSSKQPSSPRTPDIFARALGDAEGVHTRAEREALIKALCLCAEHPDWVSACCVELHLSWSEDPHDTPPIDALLLTMSELSWCEEALDKMLARPALADAALMALARSLTPWEHRAFRETLGKRELTLATCAVLAMAHPDRVERWLFDGERREQELLDGLRALLFFSEEFDTALLLETLDALGQDQDVQRSLTERLEAMLAAHDPLTYARGALDGVHELTWTEHADRVADVFTLQAGTSWLETLAALELSNARRAFGFAAMLALSASVSVTTLDLDEHPQLVTGHVDVLDLLRAQQNWEPKTAGLHMEFPLSVADEELTPLLVEVAVHERLVEANLPSPGVVGLPLSATLEDALMIEDAKKLLANMAAMSERPDEETLCVTVRTIADLRRHFAEETDTVVAERDAFVALLGTLTTHPQRAVALMANRALAQTEHYLPLLAESPQDAREAFVAGLDVPGAREELVEMVKGEGVAALWALNELTELTLDEALPLIASAYASCAIVRAPFVRQVLEELVREDSFAY